MIPEFPTQSFPDGYLRAVRENSVDLGCIDFKLCMRVFDDNFAYWLKKKLRQSERVTLPFRSTLRVFTEPKKLGKNSIRRDLNTAFGLRFVDGPRQLVCRHCVLVYFIDFFIYCQFNIVRSPARPIQMLSVLLNHFQMQIRILNVCNVFIYS